MSGIRLSETELAGLRQLVRAGEARRVVRGAGGWSTGTTVLPSSLVTRLIEHGLVYVRHYTGRDKRVYVSTSGQALVAPPRPLACPSRQGRSPQGRDRIHPRGGE